MQDYTLGNFITSLREANGYSQFQLGRLVGVTDKAVSKWENGASRPRIKTCEKLAAVFGISIDDLLSCRRGEQAIYKTKDGFDETQLWQKARDRLYELYGAAPPINLLCRMDSEEMVFKGKGIIRVIDLIGTINGRLKAYHGMLRSRDVFTSTLTAWLLGATEINPLKPHWYCPKCRSLRFDNSVKDGWDLPERICECGARMIRDGHDIPVEGAINSISRRNRIGVDIEVASTLTEKVIEMIGEYYAGGSRVERYEFEEDRYLPDDAIEGVRRLLIVPNDMPRLDLTVVMGEQTAAVAWFDVPFPYVPITLISSRVFDAYRSYEIGKGIELSRDVLQRADTYRYVYRAMQNEPHVISLRIGEQLRSVSDIVTEIDLECPSFAELRQIMAIFLTADVRQLQNRSWFMQYKEKLLDIPASPEDVWETIISRMDRTAPIGTGFPMKVMENVRLGRYGRKQQIDAETERILRELGIDEWYIDCLRHTLYLWSRVAVIENLLRYMRDVICRENCGTEEGGVPFDRL